MLLKILKMLILNLSKIWRRKFIFQIKTVKKTITDCNLLQKIVIVLALKFILETFSYSFSIWFGLNGEELLCS